MFTPKPLHLFPFEIYHSINFITVTLNEIQLRNTTFSSTYAVKTVHLLNLVTTLNLLEISLCHTENSVHLYNKFWATQKINYKNHPIFFYLLLFASVLSQFQEIINITVPRLQIYGKGTRPLVASLIYIPGCGIVHTQHWNKTIWDSIGLVKKEIKIGKSRKRAFHCILSVSKSHLVIPMASQNNGTIFIQLLISQPWMSTHSE